MSLLTGTGARAKPNRSKIRSFSPLFRRLLGVMGVCGGLNGLLCGGLNDYFVMPSVWQFKWLLWLIPAVTCYLLPFVKW